MTIDKAKLKALAEAATQGRWVFDGGTVNDWHDGEYSMEWMPNGEDCEDGTNANWKADAKYIAAANPETLLALLAENEALRKDAERNNRMLVASCITIGEICEALGIDNYSEPDMIVEAVRELKAPSL